MPRPEDINFRSYFSFYGNLCLKPEMETESPEIASPKSTRKISSACYLLYAAGCLVLGVLSLRDLVGGYVWTFAVPLSSVMALSFKGGGLSTYFALILSVLGFAVSVYSCRLLQALQIALDLRPSFRNLSGLHVCRVLFGEYPGISHLLGDDVPGELFPGRLGYGKPGSGARRALLRRHDPCRHGVHHSRVPGHVFRHRLA